eukprot:gene3403-2516_t
MAQHTNQDVGRTALGRAQEYLELGYKVIAIAGEIGSGKSTLGNLYCGWTGNAPFSVEDGTDEGTLETTGYADDVNRIYWLDTRGVGHLFDHTQWMAMLETLVVHGLILVSYPLPRSNPQLQEFSKNTFQVFDVPNLMARVKELRQALNSAERNNERLQQINHNLRRDNEHLRAELQEKQRKLEESTVSFDRLNKCFSELQAASWTFTETILRPPRSRDANRRTNTNDEQHRFQRQDVSHLFSLFCILSGPIGAALLHEQLTSYRRDVRQGARALRVALFEVCPTLSRPSYSRGGRLTEVSNGNTTVESRSTVGSRVVQTRGMATEKQLKTRINGTKNIAKITKSMKMVSAAKLRGDQQRLAAADPFAAWAANITGKERALENFDPVEFPQRNLIVTMTTDKGLCGGVNSILTRMTRQLLNKMDSQNKSYELFVLGEKGRAQMRRGYGSKFLASATDRLAPYNFDLAAALTQDALDGQFDAIHLVYNEFVSAIAYTPSIKTIVPLLDPASATLYPYEVEPENDPETLQNFFEYTLATQVYHSLLENATSEQSSRMNAMENASKNAGEMIEKLTLQYNRARQARITTELIEIISGASALKA